MHRRNKMSVAGLLHWNHNCDSGNNWFIYYISSGNFIGCYTFRIFYVVIFFCNISKHLSPRSASLRWRRKLPPQLPFQSRKSPPQSRPLQCRSPLPLHLRIKEMRPLTWRNMSLIWDPDLALTIGSSTPLEESPVWYSTDELNTPLLPVCVHSLLVCSSVNLLSFQHPSTHGYFTCTSKADQDVLLSFTSNFWSHMLSSTSCTFSPFSCFLSISSMKPANIQSQANHFDCPIQIMRLLFSLFLCYCSLV